MSKLIILRGNSGSGKTTVAKALQQKLGPNTMRLSHDTVRMEILHVWGEQGIEKSLPLMMELLKYARDNSNVTVIEGVLPAKEYSALFDLATELYGKDIFAWYYDIPFEETLRRHGTKPNRNDFGETEMRRWWREKDYLPQIREEIIDSGKSVDETVEMICNRVLDA